MTSILKTVVIAVLAMVGASFASSARAQVLGTAYLNVERRGHTATEIAGGKILVVGGENTNGAVSQAEVFDPATRTFLIIGTATPRTDHTATLLSDGRVLIAGGRDESGALNATEIFNPADNSFSSGSSMNRARAGHSATVLSDGRILIAGGDAEGSSEIYDPASQLFTLGPNLTEPRALHGAVLLKNGKVLIVGGTDPNDNTVLESAELFDGVDNGFLPTGTTMNRARALPTLKVLPDGKVQVIGGDAEFSMEMFDATTEIFGALAHLPPTSDLVSATLATQSRAAVISTTIQNNPAMQTALSDPDIAELVDRADHSITELAGQALVAGGVNSLGEVLGSSVLIESSKATVTTDVLDYPPGKTVIITGQGWQSNESVDMTVHEEPETHDDTILSAVADSKGNFANTDFAPAVSDIGRTFTLTAKGRVSGRSAQTAFSDAAIHTDYKHWKNNPGGWINGAIQASNSTYSEGNVVPHVYSITGLSIGSVYAFQVYYDYFDTNTCGLSHLEQYNNTLTPTDFGAAPSDTGVAFPDGPGHLFAVGASGVVFGSPTASGIQRSLSIKFTAAAADADFYWGLRLSVPNEYNSCAQASQAWPGASLQSNVGDTPTIADATMLGGGGTLQINPNTIATSSSIVINKVANGGDGTFNFTTTGNDLANFGITTVSGSGSATFSGVTGGASGGSRTIVETSAAGWTLTSLTCSVTDVNPKNDTTYTTDLSTGTVSVTNLGIADTLTCTYTNTASGTIEVKKVLSPTTDTGKFDLKIDSTTFNNSGSGFGNNGTTGAQSISFGTHSVSEVAHTGTTLNDYTATYSCSKNGNTLTSGSGATVSNLSVAAGDAIICTFTNTRKTGTIEVKKVLSPSNDPGKFNLQINGNTEKTDAVDGDTTGAKTVSTGTNTVGEIAGSAGVLSNYTAAIACKDNNGAGATVASGSNSGPLNVTVNAGDVIVCTITNTRDTGTIEVKKTLAPTIDPGRFDLKIDSSTFNNGGNGFGNGGTTGAQTVNSGSHGVSEVGHTGTILANYLASYSCTRNGGAAFAADLGSSVSNITVNKGDVIVCTFTNQRLQQTTAITTSLSGGGQSGTNILVPVNTPITDQATLTGATGTAGGTVTYQVFRDAQCSIEVPNTSSVKTVTNGVVPASAPVSFNQTGIFYWMATYSGDAGNLGSFSNCIEEQTTIYRILVKLTPTKDSFVKSEDPDSNEGQNNRLRLAAAYGNTSFAQAPKKAKKPTTTITALTSGVNRPVLAFNVSGLNVTGLIKAQLVLNIATNNGGWGNGQLVEARRVTQGWSEGKGKNPDLSTALTLRGKGTGTTWNCAGDTNIGNTAQDCTSAWSGGSFAAPTAPPVLHTDGSLGDMVWDVTADVLGGEAAITNGWIVKKVDENQTGGEALYFSKEGATAISKLNVAPRLILYYQ